MTKTSTSRVKQHQRKLIELGLCLWCRHPVQNNENRLCLPCLERKREKSRQERRDRKERGKKLGDCTKCSRPRVGKVELCERHFYQNCAQSRLGPPRHAEALRRKIDEQKFHCYYPGEPLLLGINAFLDHPLSVKNHPDLRSDVNNVVWCLSEINLMKNGMDRDAFLKMCGLIHGRFSGAEAVGHTDFLNPRGGPVRLPTGSTAR